MSLQRSLLLFGLTLSSCQTISNVKKRDPYYVEPHVIEYDGQNWICHDPGEYYLIMKSILD